MVETNFVNVKIQVGKTTQNVQMEKGCLFRNKSGSYCVFDDGSLKFQKAGTDKWENAGHINMTNYQWKAFQNVADNDGKSTTFSQQDILKAQEKFKKGEFTADMSKDLPTGYKIDHPKMSSADKSVEVNVTNGNETQSAKLKFQIAEIQALKDASDIKGSKSTYKNILGKVVTVITNGNKTTKYCDERRAPRDGGSICKQFAEYKDGKLVHAYMYESLGEGEYSDREYKFDTKGRVVFSGFGPNYYSTYTYDDKSKTTTERTYLDGKTYIDEYKYGDLAFPYALGRDSNLVDYIDSYFARPN